MEKELQLIDKQAAVKLLRGKCVAKYPSTFAPGLLAAADEIAQLPSTQAKPVVHKHWEFGELGPLGRSVRCPACGWGTEHVDERLWLASPSHQYCGCCGAKMDLEGYAMSAIRSPRGKMVYVKELGSLVQEDLLPDLAAQSAALSDGDNGSTGTSIPCSDNEYVPHFGGETK